MDTIEHYDSSVSRHIVVLKNGAFYVLNMFRPDGLQLSTLEIESQLKWICEDADRAPVDGPEGRIAALTAEERTVWAEARLQFFSVGTNKRSLDMIERAICFVVLEDHESGGLTDQARSAMHGTGYTRWFDKSFTFIIYTNGKVALNVEHSWADAPVMAHCGEYAFCMEFRTGYAPNGYNKRPKVAVENMALPAPRRLKWDLSPEAVDAVNAACGHARELIDNLDLYLLAFEDYGKGFIKGCHVSPDAYVQCALQLAYHKDCGKFALTYESSMTRLFRHGRTETVRPLTKECAAFVTAMLDSTCAVWCTRASLHRRALRTTVVE